ncbi:MAG: peptidyl-prolyl cis-trans isomerase [Pseudomonadales bacterium]|nr:peptidyl-prolyl cis-trans isomerase [Pseudomonadales bacterium]
MPLNPANMIREPLVGFLIVGLLLFAADHQLNQNQPTIEITPALQQRLALLWETQTGQPPDAGELRSITDNWLREEILYREALAMKLDSDDEIIRRRLVQKLEFIIDEVSPALPTDAELRQYYQTHLEDYRLPERYSFIHYFYATPEAAEEARRRALAGETINGEPTLLNRANISKNLRQIAASFGPDFAVQLADSEATGWLPVIHSQYGYHLLNLTQRLPAEVVPFENVSQKVLEDITRSQTERRRNEWLESVRDQYRIIRSDEVR